MQFAPVKRSPGRHVGRRRQWWAGVVYRVAVGVVILGALGSGVGGFVALSGMFRVEDRPAVTPTVTDADLKRTASMQARYAREVAYTFAKLNQSLSDVARIGGHPR